MTIIYMSEDSHWDLCGELGHHKFVFRFQYSWSFTIHNALSFKFKLPQINLRKSIKKKPQIALTLGILIAASASKASWCPGFDDKAWTSLYHYTKQELRNKGISSNPRKTSRCHVGKIISHKTKATNLSDFSESNCVQEVPSIGSPFDSSILGSDDSCA